MLSHVCRVAWRAGGVSPLMLSHVCRVAWRAGGVSPLIPDLRGVANMSSFLAGLMQGHMPIYLYAGGAGVVIVVMLALAERHRRIEQRLKLGLAGGSPEPNPNRGPGQSRLVAVENPLDQLAKRRLAREERREKLRERLQHAGFYDRAAGYIFTAVRGGMIVGAAGLGFLVCWLLNLPFKLGVLGGIIGGIAATVGPGLWLDRAMHKRQRKIRRALPDALDILVVCLEGGLSVMSALSRVARELASVHPLLAVELKIVERQIQLGQTAGEALRGMANRLDMEELRGMSSVLKQAEKIGSSVAEALEVFAETMRVKRHQRAEEMAQKAAVKILFPTLLFIFPAIFVVILGPAGFQLYENFICK
jgi:tight adherence protein C